ncbi:hypothetical protein [Streptomyces odonnellii]|uniref:hypothetical protein n=1 Tax=Streptomyces odonnellii TaxID=1417980 RepID=UPI0006973D2D|nr:hypothetical protein [Streptomyces odonnellii]
MICPHCNQNLLLKERPNKTCSKCHRTYVMDPKTNALRLGDARIGRLTAKLTAGGTVAVTVEQFWAAAARKIQKNSNGTGYAGAIGCALIGVPVACVLVVIGDKVSGGGVFTFFGAVILIGVLITVYSGFKNPKVARNSTMDEVRYALLTEWPRVYGSVPHGIVDRHAFRGARQRDGARVALLCPDDAIAAFLTANRVPDRYGMSVVADLLDVPDGVPVIVLHDASAAGCQVLLRARQKLPGRKVVDAGLPPRAVMRVKDAGVRGPKPTPEAIQSLRAGGTLTEAELDWLAKGWSTSLIAVPPAKLLAAVTRVAERVTASGDPVQRRAEALGFLTWPGEPRR